MLTFIIVALFVLCHNGTAFPMATSGTSTFNMDLVEIIEEAYERIGQTFETGYEWVTARRSLNLLMIEWINRGIPLWCVDMETQLLVAGTSSYTLAADTVDVLDAVLRTSAGTSSQTDVNMVRMGWSDYLAVPNKLETGRPLQFTVARDREQPVLQVWPVPDGTQTYTVAYYRFRRIEDAGSTATLNMDMPFRFLPALASGLAYQLSQKSKNMQVRALGAELFASYMEQLTLASKEDRERADTSIVPYVASVT